MPVTPPPAGYSRTSKIQGCPAALKDFLKANGIETVTADLIYREYQKQLLIALLTGKTAPLWRVCSLHAKDRAAYTAHSEITGDTRTRPATKFIKARPTEAARQAIKGP